MANNRLLRWAHASNFQLPPTFLAPSLLTLNYASTSGFSTSSPTAYPRRDKSKNRNVSAIHRSGLRKRWPLSVLKEELPRPVLQPDQHMKFEVSKDHGLWQFFNEKRTAMNTPEEYHAHGMQLDIFYLTAYLRPQGERGP
jgi:large subunit ribosomal protein L47